MERKKMGESKLRHFLKELQKEEDHRSFAERFRDFGNTTTFHGISFVTDSKHNGVRRFLWSLIVLGMSSLLIANIFAAFSEYLQYPMTSTISINYVDEIRFPAVTLCNFNQFRRSKLLSLGVEDLEQLLGPDPPEDFGADRLDQLADLTGTSQRDLGELILYNLSHNLDTMLLRCVWKSGPCSAKNFTRRLTDHGVCFTLNDPADVEQSLNVSNAGSNNGLHLRLFAETEEYSYGENKAAGFRVLLHPQGMNPLVKELGFSVSPGFESSIAVRQTVVKSLPPPYESNCSSSSMKYSQVYSVPTCRFECMMEYVLAKCGCRDYRWPGSASVCSPSQQIHCIYPYEAEFKSLEKHKQCSCPVPCTSKTFDSRLSIGYWPGIIHGDLSSFKNLSDEYIRKNYLDVYIFFEELMFSQIEQKAAYTFQSLLSNIGGYLGLLCGASLITVIEWLDFLLISLLRKYTSRKAKIRDISCKQTQPQEG